MAKRWHIIFAYLAHGHGLSVVQERSLKKYYAALGCVPPAVVVPGGSGGGYDVTSCLVQGGCAAYWGCVRHPPPCEQKNRCKNITFLQLCWQAVKCVSETIVRSKETYWFCRSFTVEPSLQILSNLTLSKRDMNNKIVKCFGEIEALSTTYR